MASKNFHLASNNRDWSSLKKFTDRIKHISRFKVIYNTITTYPNELFFMMYYGIAGIGKSALCDRLIDEFKELDGFDKNKKISKNNKLNNFFAKMDLEGGSYIHAEDFLFELRYVIEINAERYNRVKFEFPIFDTCYSMFWKKRYKNIPLMEKAEKTGMDSVMQEIASKLLDSVTMEMEGLITEIAKIGMEKIKDKTQWKNKDYNVFINRFSQLEVQKMEEYLPQALAIDIANNLIDYNQQLLIFVDTFEAIYGEISKHIEILQSGKLDSFFRNLVIHTTSLTANVSFFVFGREKIYWEEIDSSWKNIIETHLIGELSDNDARKFLTNANIPSNLIDHIIKIADGYPLYLDLSVDIYHNKVDDGEEVTEEDFSLGHMDIVLQFLKYSDNKDLLKALAVPRKWNKELYRFIIEYKHLPVSIYYFNSLKKYSFISESGEFLSMNNIMRKHIVTYLLKNEKQQTVDLINKLIEYHSDFELKHPDEITPEILFHLEEKLYLEQYLDVNTAINNFYKYYDIIELGGYYAYLNDILSDMITWNLNDNKLLSSILNSLGNVNYNLSDYDSALEYYEKSLKIEEEMGDKASIAKSLKGIGNIYIMQKNLEKGKAILSEALEIAKNINNQELINDINQIFDQLNNNEN